MTRRIRTFTAGVLTGLLIALIISFSNKPLPYLGPEPMLFGFPDPRKVEQPAAKAATEVVERMPELKTDQETRAAPSMTASQSIPGKADKPLPRAPDKVLLGLAEKTRLAGDQSQPELLIPVSGITAKSLVDTFTARRDGGRVHRAIDIMAPDGTPVLAAIDGKVAKLFESDAGGLTLYQFDVARKHVYYYAHLDEYADGISEGKKLRQGEIIGYVGSSGNADSDHPHLHFAIFKLGPAKRWWKGTAINPYPLLVGRQAP